MSKQIEIDALIKQFTQKFAELSGDNMTSARIFINCEGFNAEFDYRYADQLKKRGISMRNIKGDLIK